MFCGDQSSCRIWYSLQEQGLSVFCCTVGLRAMPMQQLLLLQRTPGAEFFASKGLAARARMKGKDR